MFVVMGATGHTGKVVAERLLEQKQKVRVLGRSKERLQSLVQRGAEAVVVDVNDQAALAKAFHGADAAYVMIPPNEKSQDPLGDSGRVAQSISGALKESGVKNVVMLSSIGADLESGTGPVVGLHRFEKMLDEIAGLNVLHLRAGYFMENTLGLAAAIAKMGYTVGLVRNDLKIPMIATKDIGNRAAEFLLDLNFKGKQVREVLGHEDLTMPEATRIIGRVLGKPEISYKQLPPEQVKPVMEQMGMSSQVADALIEMSGALNSGSMHALEPRSAENTTPTTYESFVREELLPVYQKQAA